MKPVTNGDQGDLNLPPVRLRGPVPFVGRVAQLRRLRDLLAQPPGLIVLRGEAGIGKTRLVRQLLAGLEGPVRVVDYDDVPEPVRLGPLTDVLGVPPDGDPEEVFPVLTARLAELAPLTLVLEDLHRADPASTDFLTYLATHPVPGVGALVTTRSPETGIRAPSGAVDHLVLPPLDDAEIRELAALTLRLPDPPDRLTRTLRERTAGIPFVVEEVLRALAERGGNPLDDIGVPYLLRDVVLYRTQSLGEPARDVLGAAAVAGDASRTRLLASILNLDEPSVKDALTQAVGAGLLHGPGPAFRHELARQAVYDLVPVLTRQTLHRRIARTLEASAPRPVAVLAHHYRMAGDNAGFVRNAQAAADLATARGDDATAARFLLRTMDVAELPRPVRVRLAGKLGRSAIDGLSQISAIPVLERLLADPQLPGGARGDLGLVLGRMLRQQGEEFRGYTEIERAVPFLRSPARRAQALAVLAAPDTVPGRHVRDHRERLAEAEACCGSDPVAQLAVRIARVSLLIELGDPDAWPLADTLRASSLLTGHPREHARACLNWANGALHAGCPDRARTLSAEGRALAESSGYARLLPLSDLTDLSVLRACGQEEGLEERLSALRRDCWRFPLVRLAVELELALVHQEPDELRAVAERAETAGAVLPLIRAHSGLARARLPDDPAAAARHARTALDLVRGKGIAAWGTEAADVLEKINHGGRPTRRPLSVSGPGEESWVSGPRGPS